MVRGASGWTPAFTSAAQFCTLFGLHALRRQARHADRALLGALQPPLGGEVEGEEVGGVSVRARSHGGRLSDGGGRDEVGSILGDAEVGDGLLAEGVGARRSRTKNGCSGVVQSGGSMTNSSRFLGHCNRRSCRFPSYFNHL